MSEEKKKSEKRMLNKFELYNDFHTIFFSQIKKKPNEQTNE